VVVIESHSRSKVVYLDIDRCPDVDDKLLMLFTERVGEVILSQESSSEEEEEEVWI